MRALAFTVSHPNELLATILVGSNIANILAASLSTAVAARFFENNAVGVATGLVTIVILVFGETIPKAFAPGPRGEALYHGPLYSSVSLLCAVPSG